MPAFTMETVRAEIEGLVRELLANAGFKGELTPDAALAELGMTSMDMVNLMLGVEARFDVMIPAEFLTPEHFRSVASVERMISGLLGVEALARVA